MSSHSNLSKIPSRMLTKLEQFESMLQNRTIKHLVKAKFDARVCMHVEQCTTNDCKVVC
jgi:hypothetical protein